VNEFGITDDVLAGWALIILALIIGGLLGLFEDKTPRE